MAYDRYDTRRERERGRDGDNWDNDRGRQDERGFFERAGDEIASWFGDDEAERRRRHDERMMDRHPDYRDYRGRGESDRRFAIGGWGERDRELSSRRMSRPQGDRDSRSGYGGYERDFSPRGYGARGIERGYSPTYVGGSGYSGGYGGYGYGSGSESGYGSSGYGGAFTGSDYERRDFERSESPWGRDDYRRTSEIGSGRDSDHHYSAWRRRQLDELDRDYDDYHRERQQRFEQDFGSWREQRQQKRAFLPQIREHMEVVGNDGEKLGEVDCVKRDKIVLTKSDSDDGRHHWIPCTMIDKVEGDKVCLDVSAEQAKTRWSNEERSGFFRRDDDEDVNLERSFSGTYS